MQLFLVEADSAAESPSYRKSEIAGVAAYEILERLVLFLTVDADRCQLSSDDSKIEPPKFVCLEMVATCLIRGLWP